MIYPWLKVIHLCANFLWVGGMVAVMLALASHRFRSGSLSGEMITTLRQWDSRVTAPAMGLAWAFGLWMVFSGGWWPDTWIMIKLIPVLILSALHGMLSGSLKRLENDQTHTLPPPVQFAFPIVVICVVSIVILVIIKPF